MGAFTARATSISGWAELPDRARPTVGRGKVRVDAAALRTGIGLRARHLREELDTDHYPKITLVVNEVSPRAGGPPASAGLKPVMLKGTFTVKVIPHLVALHERLLTVHHDPAKSGGLSRSRIRGHYLAPLWTQAVGSAIHRVAVDATGIWRWVRGLDGSADNVCGSY